LGVLLAFDDRLMARRVSLELPLFGFPVLLKSGLGGIGRLFGRDLLALDRNLPLPGDDLRLLGLQLGLGVGPFGVLGRIRLGLMQLAFLLQMVVAQHRTNCLLGLTFEPVDQTAAGGIFSRVRHEPPLAWDTTGASKRQCPLGDRR
jgi:hypothetical protein